MCGFTMRPIGGNRQFLDCFELKDTIRSWRIGPEMSQLQREMGPALLPTPLSPACGPPKGYLAPGVSFSVPHSRRIASLPNMSPGTLADAGADFPIGDIASDLSLSFHLSETDFVLWRLKQFLLHLSASSSSTRDFSFGLYRCRNFPASTVQSIPVSRRSLFLIFPLPRLCSIASMISCRSCIRID